MAKIKFRYKLKASTVKVVIAILLSAFCVLVYFIITYRTSDSRDNPNVLTVNGEAITLREFTRKLSENKANIFSYFHQKYGAADGAGFWSGSYNGEAPLEMIKRQTSEQLVRIKLQQILAKKKGLVEDISYTAFLKNLENENSRRKKAVENKQAIYGPVKYSEQDYFAYVFSNMVIRLKEKLGEQELAASENELKEYYSFIKEKSFKRTNTIKTKLVSISYADESGKFSEESKKNALDVMERIKERLAQGEKLDEVAANIQAQSGPNKITSAERVFDENSSRNDREEWPNLLEAVSRLSVGQYSGVIDEHNKWTIILCQEIKDMGYMPFDEVKPNVKSMYLDKKYEELIGSLVKESEMVFNHAVYDKVDVK